jgi:hypothetical protein
MCCHRASIFGRLSMAVAGIPYAPFITTSLQHCSTMRKETKYGGISKAASRRRCFTRHCNIHRILCAGQRSANNRNQRAGYRTNKPTNRNRGTGTQQHGHYRARNNQRTSTHRRAQSGRQHSATSTVRFCETGSAPGRRPNVGPTRGCNRRGHHHSRSTA